MRFFVGTGPWAQHGRKVEYPAEACARSTRILGRAVSFQVSPDFTQTQVVQIIEGVGKVLRTLA